MTGRADDASPGPLTRPQRGRITPSPLDPRVRRHGRPAPRPARWTSRRSSRATLIDRLFALGVMGIEVPESLGGAAAGSSTRCSPSRNCRESTRPSACSSTSRTRSSSMRSSVGARRSSSRSFCPASRPSHVGAYALSEAEAGSDAFALADAGPRRRRRLRARRPQALDHERRRSGSSSSSSRRSIRRPAITASPRFVVDRDDARTVDRPEGRQARAFARRAPAKSCSRAAASRARACSDPVGAGYKVAIETLNEGRIGIGAQMVGLAAGALEHADRPCQGAQAVRPRDRRVSGRAVSDSARRGRHRSRAPAGLQRRPPPRLPASPFSPKPPCASSSPRKSQSAPRRSPSTCSAAPGFVKDGRVEKFYRDAKIGQIYEGTSNMQLLTIAKQLLH